MDDFIESAHKDIQRLVEITSTITNLDNLLKQVKAENEAYKELRQRQEEIITNQANEIDSQKQKNQQLSEENNRLNQVIEERDKLIEELKARIAELESLKQNIEDNFKELEEKYSKLEGEKKQLEEEKQGLEDQVTQLTEKQQQNEQELSTLQTQTNEEKQQLLEELSQAKSKSLAGVEIPTAETATAQEAQIYIEMLNSILKDDNQLSSKMPLDASNPECLFQKLQDGVILCKFLNAMLPNTIDPRAINIKEPLEEEHQLQNLNMAISGAKSHGCMLGGMQSEDIYNGKQEDILNIIWQIARASLINTINVQNCPNLLSLKENEENQENFMKLSPEDILKRWMNAHLKQAHIHRTVNNFSTDLKDGEVLLGLTNYLERHHWSTEVDNTKKIKKSIKSAQAMGTDTLVRPEPVSTAHPKLGLLFCAQLFKAVPGLKTISEDESKQLATLIEGQDMGDSREFIYSNLFIKQVFFRERTFRMWLNSLSLANVKYLTNLFEDICDGLVLLKVLDYMQPGCVTWDKVQKNPTHFLQKTANCNMFMDIAKKSLGLQLIAIGSEDILNKNKKLVLAIFWQLMIRDVMKTIGDLKESDLVKWANERVGEKEPKIKNLKDPNIKNCVFLFNLLSAINPKLIDWSIVQEDDSQESIKSNAQYIISIVRKLGASLFLVWEDIIELKTKMIMTLFASLKSFDKEK